MNDLVCYCFEYPADDIQEDVTANNGRSTILEEIAAAKKAGGCHAPPRIPKAADVWPMSAVYCTRLSSPTRGTGREHRLWTQDIIRCL
jgi:hypothetical protein